jgi:hypothetical protein
MPGVEGEVAERCAVHPSLPAAGACPVCARPRCASDAAAAPGGGCLACEGRTRRPGPPPVDLRALVAAGLACNLAVIPAGFVASEYVDAGGTSGLFVGSVAVPAFVAIGVSMAAEAAARKRRGRSLRLLAAGYAVLAIAIGWAQPRAAETAFTVEALPAYAVAAVVSWLWTVPPRVVTKREEPG